MPGCDSEVVRLLDRVYVGIGVMLCSNRDEYDDQDDHSDAEPAEGGFKFERENALGRNQGATGQLLATCKASDKRYV